MKKKNNFLLEPFRMAPWTTDLVAIKRLLILQLITSGVKMADIAFTLEVPVTEIKKMKPPDWDQRY